MPDRWWWGMVAVLSLALSIEIRYALDVTYDAIETALMVAFWEGRLDGAVS